MSPIIVISHSHFCFLSHHPSPATLQAIQDMNSLKRFVRQAEMSHYALFRCCQFLQTCGNGDVLLQNARAEHSDLPEACNIITVLEEFLSEQNQAQAWLHQYKKNMSSVRKSYKSIFWEKKLYSNKKKGNITTLYINIWIKSEGFGKDFRI